MDELQVIEKQLEDSVDFKSMVELAKTSVPQMIKSTDAAMGAMMKIEKIESEEDDIKVNNLLSRVKQTYDKVNVQRRQLTDPSDEFRKSIMLIEGELDPKKGKDNHYNRLKQLREAYAQAKLDKKRSEEESLNKVKLANTALINLEAVIKTQVSSGPVDKLIESEEILTKWYDGITLENFDEKEKMLKMKPKLKKELYDSFFETTLDMTGVEQGKVDEVIAKLKKEFDYESLNTDYSSKGVAALKVWEGKLPELKTRLEAISKAEGEDAEKLKAQLVAKKAIEAEEATKKLTEEKADKAREIANDATDSKVEEEFIEQGSRQMLEGKTGPSKYVARFTEDKWLKPLATVIYHVAIHKDFPGIYKKDRNGKIKVDEKGRQVYIDPIDYFMKFYASKCNAKVDGLKLFEDVKVTTRQAKA